MARVVAPERGHNPITSCIIRSREQIRAWEIRAGHVAGGSQTSKPSAPFRKGRGQGTGGRKKRNICLVGLIFTSTSFQKALKARQ